MSSNIASGILILKFFGKIELLKNVVTSELKILLGLPVVQQKDMTQLFLRSEGHCQNEKISSSYQQLPS